MVNGPGRGTVSWREVPVPGADQALSMARIRVEPGGAFWAFVRFPAGFSRRTRGHYLEDEHFWIIEGELHMNGERYGPGDSAQVPARTPRAETETPSGALALAWFSAPPRWEAEPA